MNGFGRYFRLGSRPKQILATFGLLFGIVGCSIAAGAGLGAAMVGTAALTSGCYDSVDVEVVDAVTGNRACRAEVIAQEAGGSETRFSSCFHAELPTGRWLVTARQPGYRPASSEVVVSKGRGCEPAVQSVALSLRQENAPPATPVAVRPPRPGEAPINRETLSAPASMGAGLPEEPTAPAGISGAPGRVEPPGANGGGGAAATAPIGTAAFAIGGGAGVLGGSAGAAGAGAGAASGGTTQR